MKNKIIFYEELTPVNFVLTLPLIFKAKNIFILGFHRDTVLVAKDFKFMKKIIRAINKNVQIEVLNHRHCRNFLWQVNKASAETTGRIIKLDAVIAAYKKQFERIEKLHISDFSWLRFFHRILLLPIRRRILFYECALMLEREFKNEKLIFVPANRDEFGIFAEKKEYNDILKRTRFYIKATLSIWQYLRSLAVAAMGLCYILSYAKRGIRFKKPQIIEKKWGQYVTWGLNKTMSRFGRRIGYDDHFLLDEDAFSPENILFIRNRKDTTGRLLEETIERAKEINAAFADEVTMKPTVSFLFMHSIRYVIFMAKTTHLWFLNQKNSTIDVLYCLWWSATQYELAAMYYRVKIAICFDDQFYRHIVRTWVFNKYGMKTMGLQHSLQGGLYILPELAFVYFDKYCIYSDKHKEMFAPYWDNLDTDKIGMWRTDFIYRSQFNKELQEYRKTHLKDRFIIHTSVSLMPDYEKNDLVKLKDFYKALNTLVNIDDKIIITIYPRHADHLTPYLPLIKDNMHKGKIILGADRFTNHEWTAIADAVIAPDTSSNSYEAICAGKYGFAFNFDNVPNPIKDYLDKLDVDTIDSMVNNIREIYQGEWKRYEDIFEQVRNEFSFGFDGRCIERMKECLKKMIQN